MPSELPVPVLDDHVHLDPRGRRGGAVKEFARAGGTHLILVHKPYGPAPRDAEGFRDEMRTTLRLAEEAREASDVAVWIALGPHPAQFTKLLDAGLDLDGAADAYRRGLEVAGELIEEHDDVVALGEIGRPHWRPVDPDVLERANALMEEAFALASDLDVPVQIHAEEATRGSYADIAQHLDAAGLPRERAIKHYASPLVDPEDTAGLFPSVLVDRDSAREAAEAGTRFVMETDYLDDPDRPGAVLGPKTVPRRTETLLEEGILAEDALHRIHVENPQELYGIDIEDAL